MSGISPEAPDPKAYVLGGEMRAHREAARLVQRELARRLGVSHSMVVRWERGMRVPDVDHISRFVDALNLSALERDRLMQRAREAADEPVNEVSAGTRGQEDALETLIEFEQVATQITVVSTMLVPGLMQTGAYARLAIGDMPDVETRVATRIGRRDVITRERDPVQYTAYLLETVLHQPVDTPVLVDQLRLFSRLGDLPNVHLRVIPLDLGITAAHMGPFVLLEFANVDPIVYMEQLSTSVFLRDREDVREHEAELASLDHMAMSPRDSLELITDVIDDKRETTA